VEPTRSAEAILAAGIALLEREVNGRAHIERPPFAMHRNLHGAQPHQHGPHKPKPTPTPTPR